MSSAAVVVKFAETTLAESQPPTSEAVALVSNGEVATPEISVTVIQIFS
jgi:hypothetical protein